MTQGIYEILRNVPLTDTVFEMVLGGDTSAITAPGQFINIQLAGKYLRRPISICDWDEKTITIIAAVDIFFLSLSFLDYLSTYLFRQKHFEELHKGN